MSLLIGMVVGIAIALVAIGWMILAQPDDVWSLEQAAEFKAANEDVHAALSHDPALKRSAGAEPNTLYLAGAQARLDKIKRELERARNARDNWGKWGAASGLAVTVACGLGFLATRHNRT